MEIKVLLLAANPKTTTMLRLSAEFRNVKETIQRSMYRDKFKVRHEGALRLDDLRNLMLSESPHIIHFSAHGYDDAICLENDEGHVELVKSETLRDILSLNDSICCIILNSCYSSSQAYALKDISPYIIGMDGAIQDELAINFSVGFYNALTENKSLEEAFKAGSISLRYHNQKNNSNRSLDIGKEFKGSTPVLVKGNIDRALPHLMEFCVNIESENQEKILKKTMLYGIMLSCMIGTILHFLLFYLNEDAMKVLWLAWLWVGVFLFSGIRKFNSPKMKDRVDKKITLFFNSLELGHLESKVILSFSILNFILGGLLLYFYKH